MGKRSIQAFIYTGNKSLEFIDLTSNCLINTNDLDWISQDSVKSLLIILTSDKNFLGVHQIVLIQIFDDFEGVYPFTTFNLRILPPPAILEKGPPPYFDNELVP